MEPEVVGALLTSLAAVGVAGLSTVFTIISSSKNRKLQVDIERLKHHLEIKKDKIDQKKIELNSVKENIGFMISSFQKLKDSLRGSIYVEDQDSRREFIYRAFEHTEKIIQHFSAISESRYGEKHKPTHEAKNTAISIRSSIEIEIRNTGHLDIESLQSIIFLCDQKQNLLRDVRYEIMEEIFE